MRKLLGLMLAATAALGVAACGSSNKTDASATTYVVTTPGAPTTSTPSTPAAQVIKPGPTRHHRLGVPHPVTKPRGRTIRYTEKVTGPTPAFCLRQAGMLNPHTVSRGETAGRAGTTGGDVFVDGPFKNAGQAASSAASLQGVETVQAARLYVVSTLRTARLGAVVKQVASCLKGAKGYGFLTF